MERHQNQIPDQPPAYRDRACEGEAGRAENALQSLYEISKILASPGRLPAVLSSVLTELARFVDLQRGLIAIHRRRRPRDRRG